MQKKGKRKTRKKEKKGKQGGKRDEAGGSAQNSTVEDRHSTGEEEDQPRTVEQRIYRRHTTRKLRKLNDGGKLEIVKIKTHNMCTVQILAIWYYGQRAGKEARMGEVGECPQRIYLSVKEVD